MELTVGNLKEILNQLDDDVLLADLAQSNREFYKFDWVKRLYLLEDKEGKKYLTINSMGSHFDKAHIKMGLKIIGYIQENNRLKID